MKMDEWVEKYAKHWQKKSGFTYEESKNIAEIHCEEFSEEDFKDEIPEDSADEEASYKLLNCPFCGGESEFNGVYLDHSVEWVNAQCSDCECRTDDYQVPKPFDKKSIADTEAKVLGVWNKRSKVEAE